jgi:DNA polymerase III epsilon subunit-like protein
MRRRALLFVDLETTGLDPDVHEIIEAAWRLTSSDGKTTLHETSVRVLPEHIESASPEALIVNGYQPELWTPDQCLAQQQFADVFARASADVTLAGHGLHFDESFIRPCLKRFGLRPAWHYQSVDTQKMSWPLVHAGVIHKPSLSVVAEYFGFSQPEPHRALQDVDTTHRVYMHLMELYSKAIAA